MPNQHPDANKWEYVTQSGKQKNDQAGSPNSEMRPVVFDTTLALYVFGAVTSIVLMALYIIANI